MSSDVKAVRITATGDVGVGPARIRAVHAVSGGVGAGRITLTDGNGGTTKLDFDVVQSSDADLTMPGEGIRFESTMWVSAFTNLTAVTIIYG